MSYTAISAPVAGNPVKASFGAAVREQLLGLGQGIYLGPLNLDRGYRALSTSYVLPSDYGRVRIDWDRLGTGWSVFALFELIVDVSGSPAETGQVEIVDLSGPTQVVEMASAAAAATWTVQTALVIPSSTGIKYYSARVKGSDATVGVGVVGGIYLAAP